MAPTLKLTRTDANRWFDSPLLKYAPEGRGSPVVVDVTGSAVPLKGSPLSTPIQKLLSRFKRTGKSRILDFGAGIWLRYTDRMARLMPERELYVVEWAEAFEHRGSELDSLVERLKQSVVFWTPADFVKWKNRNQRFDLILLVNVLNTIPEESFREEIFSELVKHLFPGGWLALYQRIWAKGEDPEVKYEYGQGWIVPHERHNYCTYRASTGATWFNDQARKHDLRPLLTDIRFKSSNTLFRIWQRRFG